MQLYAHPDDLGTKDWRGRDRDGEGGGEGRGGEEGGEGGKTKREVPQDPMHMTD